MNLGEYRYLFSPYRIIPSHEAMIEMIRDIKVPRAKAEDIQWKELQRVRCLLLSSFLEKIFGVGGGQQQFRFMMIVVMR
jgi:hypothetical protein